jgi:hypothetical protein
MTISARFVSRNASFPTKCIMPQRPDLGSLTPNTELATGTEKMQRRMRRCYTGIFNYLQLLKPQVHSRFAELRRWPQSHEMSTPRILTFVSTALQAVLHPTRGSPTQTLGLPFSRVTQNRPPGCAECGLTAILFARSLKVRLASDLNRWKKSIARKARPTRALDRVVSEDWTRIS